MSTVADIPAAPVGEVPGLAASGEAAGLVTAGEAAGLAAGDSGTVGVVGGVVAPPQAARAISEISAAIAISARARKPRLAASLGRPASRKSASCASSFPKMANDDQRRLNTAFVDDPDPNRS